MDTLLKFRGQKGDGFCLIFSIFFEDTSISVKREERLDGNDKESRKNISSNFNEMKKSGFSGYRVKEEHRDKVVSGRVVSEIKAFYLKGWLSVGISHQGRSFENY